MMMPRGSSGSTARVVFALLAGAWTAGCAPAARPEGTVVYASGADLESANPLVTVHPLSRQVQRFALFVTLARYDSTLEPRPYAARRWRWTDGGRTLTLDLETALRWHDGAPTTAGDAAFTIEAARDRVTGYPRAADLAAVVDVAARDDSTLVLHFASPQPAFPSVLCELPILPRHLLAGVERSAMRAAPFNDHPVGNGPFRFESRRAGQRWVFARNDAFPSALGGPPSVQRLVVAVVDEATTKFAGLVSGDLDVAGIAPTTASLAARDPSLRVLTYPVLFSTALVFNTHRPPFDDVRVRRAVSLALDRRRIVDGALGGLAAPATSIVPLESGLALPGTVGESARRADALLDDAGWRRDASGGRRRDGDRLTVELLTVGSSDNAVEQLVQADLAARGIEVRVRQLELGAFLAAARARPARFDVLLTGIPGDLSLAYLAAMFDSRQAGGALDYADYHSARLDSLFGVARSATSERRLVEAWRDVQRELAAEAPVAWVYHSRGVQGVSRRLSGVTMDLRGELATLHDWRISQPATTVARATP